MRYAAPLFAALLLALVMPAEACSIPSFAISSRAPEAFGDLQVYRIRTVNALVRTRPDSEGSTSVPDLLALEAVVVEASQQERELTLIRIIVPERWGTCGQLSDPEAINELGQIEGYVLLRPDPLTGFYETRFDSGRNRERLLRHSASLEWRPVTFR